MMKQRLFCLSLSLLLILSAQSCTDQTRAFNWEKSQTAQQAAVSGSFRVKPSQDILKQQTQPYYCEPESQDASESTAHAILYSRSDLGNIPIIEFRSGGDPASRCQDVAAQFTRLHQENSITYLAWKRQPKGRIIYVTQYEGDVYRDDEYLKYLFTLIHPTDEPHTIMDALKGMTSTNPTAEGPIKQ